MFEHCETYSVLGHYHPSMASVKNLQTTPASFYYTSIETALRKLLDFVAQKCIQLLKEYLWLKIAVSGFQPTQMDSLQKLVYLDCMNTFAFVLPLISMPTQASIFTTLING